MNVDGLELPDSTANAYSSIAADAASTAVPVFGLVGEAAEFDGVDDLHSAGDPADGSLDFGMESFSVSF